MMRDGVKPYNYTVTKSLLAVGKITYLSYGTLLQGFAMELGVHKETEVQNNILEMYCLCGAVKEARNYFEQIQVEVVNEAVALDRYGLMIQGYALSFFHGEASVLFNEMVSKGIRPDSYAFPLLFTRVFLRIH